MDEGEAMVEFFQGLLSGNFMPHGTCYLWDPQVLWLNVISDGLISICYYAIPILLFLFFRKRKDLTFRWVFVAFAVFILACGTTHAMGVWTVWHGTYRLEGLIKAVTAASSLATAILLIPLLPSLLNLPNPVALQQLNRELQAEMDKRHKMADVVERQASLMELAHDGILVRSLDGTILFWNRGAEEMYGWSREEAVGQKLHDLLKTDLPEARDRVERQLQVSGRWEGELIHTRRDGTTLAVASRWALRRGNDQSQPEVMQINIDITEQRQSREALREVNQQLERRVSERTAALQQTATSLERSNSELQQQMERGKRLEDQLLQAQKMEAVGRLAGGVAHDFNNLLTVISGYNRMVLDEVGELPNVAGYAGEIQNAADRAASLTNQLLAFSRRQIVQPRIIDINDVVRSTEKLLQRVIGEDIDFATSLDPALASVHADPSHIDQVIMNLVVNARDAMPQGGKITVETSNVELDQDYAGAHVGIVPGPYVQLAISDTGVGMSDATKQRIFEPFFTTKELGKGTGLGLSIVYGIVKESGGHVLVYSQEGRGTTFKIYLPAIARASGMEPKKRLDPGTLRGSEVILLVEDEASVRKLACALVSRQGYKVLESGNGNDAIQMSRDHPDSIHLLLTDVVMPGLSGPDLAEKLAASHPEMKVLYMSGYADNAIVRHGMLGPNVAFIQKPFMADDLCRKIREVLEG